MVKLPVYNLEGKELEKVSLNDKSFSCEFNPALVHQVTTILQNNKRIYTAHTKTKGEVRGGGKKPWKQKGTGRARAGSIRSPLWVGGGVTFGPRNNRNYSRKINKQERHLAFAMVFGSKSADKEIKVVDNWNIGKPKTKELFQIISRFGISSQSALLVSAKNNENLVRAGKNLPRVDIKVVANINMLDLLSHKFVIIEKEALASLENRVGKEVVSSRAPKNKAPIKRTESVVNL